MPNASCKEQSTTAHAYNHQHWQKGTHKDRWAAGITMMMAVSICCNSFHVTADNNESLACGSPGFGWLPQHFVLMYTPVAMHPLSSMSGSYMLGIPSIH